MASKIGKSGWIVLYAFAAIVDIAQIVVDLTGIGVVVSEVADPIVGTLILIQFQMRGVSMIRRPSRIVSLLGVGGLETITGGIAPAWVVDIWYIHKTVKQEEAIEMETAKQNMMLQMGGRMPANVDGVRLPRNTSTGNTGGGDTFMANEGMINNTNVTINTGNTMSTTNRIPLVSDGIRRAVNKGMTLAELVVSIAIFVLIMVGVSMFQYNVLNYNRNSQVALTNAEEAQNLLKYMNKEIRAMSTGANGSYNIANAATSTITFFADIDSDSVQEQVRYYIASSTIYRGVTEPSGTPAVYNLANESKRILATGVRNSNSTAIFEYYNGAYDGTTAAMSDPLTITSIRLIKINITIDSDISRWPTPRTFSTQVSLRNLKDNL